MNWWGRLRHREALEQQLDKELRFHLDERIAALRRGGLSEDDARRRAHQEFGGMAQIQEACRDARGTQWLESIVQDLRYAVRTLRQAPAFTAASILTLALGIGANTAIFQLLDAIRLRSLPVPDPQQLAKIQIANGRPFGVSHYSDNLSYPIFEQIRQHQEAFSGVFAWDSGYGAERIGTGEQARMVPVLRVSGDFFPTVGIAPAAGRLLAPDDDLRGCAEPRVVLSHTFWQREYGGQFSAIGSRITVGDQPFEIIGVTPRGFTGPEVGSVFDLALPLCSLSVLHAGDQPPFGRRDLFWLNVMARLKPGWTLARANAQLQSISPGIMQTTVPSGYSRKSLDRYRAFRLGALPGATGVSRWRDDYDRSLFLLLGLTGLVLLLACANLANLMLARAGARGREFAVRVALGAARIRLIRQSLTESLLIAAAGALLGVYLAAAASRGIVQFLSTSRESLRLDLALDGRMLLFTFAVTCVTCVLFGLAPALRSARSHPADAMKQGGRGVTTGRERFGFQRALVVVQVAVSLVLVTGAVLFGDSFRRLATLDPGFRSEGVLTVDFGIPRQAPLLRQAFDTVRAAPLVESAAATTNYLIGGGSWSLGISVGNAPAKAESAFTWVTPGYFATLETPILAGRDFTANDSENAPKVAVVNEIFARQFFPGVNPIGQVFRTAAEPHYPEAEYQVVGLIRNTRYLTVKGQEHAMAYGALPQYPPGPSGSLMYVRSSATPAAVEASLRRRVAAWRPGTPVQFQVFQQQIAESLMRERLLAALSGVFGALAAVLATIGLYGVLAYQTVRRRNELGIRVALGATRGQIVGLVVREAAMLVTLGLAIGLAGSLSAGNLAASLLFGISARDPWRLAAAALALAIAAGIGSLLPARRASRLDPMAALRDE